MLNLPPDGRYHRCTEGDLTALASSNGAGVATLRGYVVHQIQWVWARIQSPIVWSASGAIVSSVFEYSVVAPVFAVWNR
jgi:hypothetical protein